MQKNRTNTQVALLNRSCVHTHTHTHGHTHTHTRTYTDTHIHTHIRTYTYSLTSTHTLSLSLIHTHTPRAVDSERKRWWFALDPSGSSPMTAKCPADPAPSEFRLQAEYVAEHAVYSPSRDQPTSWHPDHVVPGTDGDAAWPPRSVAS
jgi:hypothetical protein